MAIVAHHRRTRADGRPDISPVIPFARPWLRLGTRSRLACLQPKRATPRLPGWGSFVFKSLLGRWVFLRMIGAAVAAASCEAGAAACRPCARPLTDQRDAISACRSAQRQRHHLVALKIRAFQHHGPKLLHLRLVQRQRASGAATRTQSGHAFRVVAQHPVTQCLPIHAVQLAPPPRVDGPPAPVLLPADAAPPHGLRPRRQFPSSVAERSKRVISIGLPIRLHSLRIVATRRGNRTQADSGISPGKSRSF